MVGAFIGGFLETVMDIHSGDYFSVPAMPVIRCLFPVVPRAFIFSRAGRL